MRLSRALRVGPGSVVAFVGGGGKTNSMFRLAAELAENGPVITTTTTRIFAAQISLAPAHYQVSSPDDLPGLVGLLESHPHILITGEPDSTRSGKAPGISLETLSAILSRTASLAPAVLIEADGSRMRPFKAPGPHEPVIPPQATHVVPVVGADAMGKPLRDEYVHRAALVAELAGAAPGSPITPEIIARILLHPEGGRKGVPASARLSLLFNKVESPEGLRAGLKVITRLLSMPGAQESRLPPVREVPTKSTNPIEVRSPVSARNPDSHTNQVHSPQPDFSSVLLASVKSMDPVQAVYGRTAGIVLAAGESRRFEGGPKQLAGFQGKPLVAHAVDAAISAGLEEVIVVTGSSGTEVAAALGERPARLVENPGWAEGQSTSLKSGLRAVSPGVDAAIFLLGDQPLVSPDLIRELLETHRTTLAPIVAPRHLGRRGNPDLFDRATWPDLFALSGDVGGRLLFEKYDSEVAWVEWDETIFMDIDTEADYKRLIG